MFSIEDYAIFGNKKARFPEEKRASGV